MTLDLDLRNKGLKACFLPHTACWSEAKCLISACAKLHAAYAEQKRTVRMHPLQCDEGSRTFKTPARAGEELPTPSHNSASCSPMSGGWNYPLTKLPETVQCIRTHTCMHTHTHTHMHAHTHTHIHTHTHMHIHTRMHTPAL